MKAYQNPELIRGLAAVVGGFALFTATLQGAPFLYSPGDLVLAIRQTGNASDLVVNIGKATNYSSLPPGVTVVVTNLSVSQLNSAFPSVNELRWSVASANRPPLNPNYPLQTLWVTRPRLDASVPGTPWLRKGQASQGNAGGQIDAVGNNTATASSTLPGGPGNTATGVIIPVGNNPNVGTPIGTAGNYVGNFQGNVESLTAADFDSDANNVSRADLYELLPALAAGDVNKPGRYLGYFELKPNGTLTFKAGPPPPLLNSIVRNGTVSTVSFTTVSGATYRLRSTSNLSSPLSTWSIGPTLTGTGFALSLQDTNAAEARFFVVDAQ